MAEGKRTQSDRNKYIVYYNPILFRDIADKMPMMGADFGMRFLSKPQILSPRGRLNSKQDLERYLNEVGNGGKFDLAFVIISDYIGGANTYRKTIHNIVKLKIEKSAYQNVEDKSFTYCVTLK